MRPALLRYTAPSAGGASISAVSTSGRILLPTNYIQSPFELGVGIFFSSDAAAAAGVATVFFTYDSMSQDDFFDVGVSQTTTVITVTDPNLPARGGIAVGDVARLQGVLTQPSAATGIDGEYVVATVVSPTSYTLTSTISQSLVAQYGAKAATFKMQATLIKNAVLARVFGNLSAGLAAATATGILNTGPVTGVALGLTVLTAGSAYLQVLQGSGSR